MVAAQLQDSLSRPFVALSVGWSPPLLAWVTSLLVYQGGLLLGLG